MGSFRELVRPHWSELLVRVVVVVVVGVLLSVAYSAAASPALCPSFQRHPHPTPTLSFGNGRTQNMKGKMARGRVGPEISYLPIRALGRDGILEHRDE